MMVVIFDRFIATVSPLRLISLGIWTSERSEKCFLPLHQCDSASLPLSSGRGPFVKAHSRSPVFLKPPSLFANSLPVSRFPLYQMVFFWSASALLPVPPLECLAMHSSRLKCFLRNFRGFFLNRCRKPASTATARVWAALLRSALPVLQIIRKGWLTISNIGFMKGGARKCWFILTTQTLSWFRDDSVRHSKDVR